MDQVLGQKRTIDKVAGVADSPAKRVATADELGKPRVEPRSPRSAFSQLPWELLPKIVRYLDLCSFRSLLSVSTHINRSLVQQTFSACDSLKPRNFSAFLGNLTDLEVNCPSTRGKIQQWMGGEIFSLHQENSDDLIKLAENPSVRFLRLEVLNSCPPLSDMLQRMEDKVKARVPEKDKPTLSVDLIIGGRVEIEPEAIASLKLVLSQLEHVRITHLGICDDGLARILPHLPSLEKLSLSFTDVNAQLSLGVIAESLVSRNARLPYLNLSGWSTEGQEQAAKDFIQVLGGLGIKQVDLDGFELETLPEWKSCKVERLQLKSNFGYKESEAVGKLLKGKVLFKTLILSDNGDWPVNVAHLALFAKELEENQGLRRLEVGLSRTHLDMQGELLMAVFKNQNITYAFLPYPLEFQEEVDRMMAATTNLTIERRECYNSSDIKAELRSLCESAEKDDA